MSGLNVARLAACMLAGLALAVASGLHAVSMVGTKSSSETASELFPANGPALALHAFSVFSTEVAEAGKDANAQTAALVSAARSVRPIALDAVRREPLSAKAHALLALSASDEAERSAIISAASRLNRRDLTLQGLVLEERLAGGNYAEVIETLDQILRVHPSYGQDFFPILGDALLEEETIPVFVALMDGSSPWHERFAEHALRKRELLPHLALIRAERPLVDAEFDQSLVLRLSQADVGAAEALFKALGGEARQASGSRTLQWNAEFPPFDWLFSDEPDFRAQMSRDGQQLEVLVRPGKGGVIAERIVTMPNAPFTLVMSHSSGDASSRDQNVRLQLRCANQNDVFFEQALQDGENRLVVESIPSDCPQIAIGVNARAWSGRSSLNARIGRIRLIES